jgi:hypothetical protein
MFSSFHDTLEPAKLASPMIASREHARAARLRAAPRIEAGGINSHRKKCQFATLRTRKLSYSSNPPVPPSPTTSYLHAGVLSFFAHFLINGFQV